MNTHSGSGSPSPDGPDEQFDAPGEVLKALGEYRVAEAATRRSTKDSIGLGERDLTALRHVLRAQAAGERVGPKDLSRVLQITTASTTSLIDRLVNSGHVRREPHPTDRRSLVVVPTMAADSEVSATLGALHSKMMGVAEELSATEARVVIDFLRRMGAAVSGPDAGR
jgi:DNA-binding MarR family transcriptional regulator